MSVVVSTAACLLIFGALEAIIITQWAVQRPAYKIAYWMVLTPKLHELGKFSSNAKISGYLQYQLLGMLLKCLWLQHTEDINQDLIHFKQDLSCMNCDLKV